MNRIKELREDRDLRQTDVSIATGIDQRTLSNYETGKTNPDSAAIIKLSRFFGVTCDYLLGETCVNISGADTITEELESIKKRLDHIQLYLSANRNSQGKKHPAIPENSCKKRTAGPCSAVLFQFCFLTLLYSS